MTDENPPTQNPPILRPYTTVSVNDLKIEIQTEDDIRRWHEAKRENHDGP